MMGFNLDGEYVKYILSDDGIKAIDRLNKAVALKNRVGKPLFIYGLIPLICFDVLVLTKTINYSLYWGWTFLAIQFIVMGGLRLYINKQVRIINKELEDNSNTHVRM
jgi:hypothetical protein